MTDFVGTIPLCLKAPKGSLEPAFLAEKQVASLLAVSVQFLRKCRTNGTGPVWNRMEGCIRYPIAGLHAYIAETQRDFTGQTVNENRRPALRTGGAV